MFYEAWAAFVTSLYTIAEHWKLILFLSGLGSALGAFITRLLTRRRVSDGIFVNTVNLQALIPGPNGYDQLTAGGNKTLESIFPGPDFEILRKAIVRACKREGRKGADGILHLADPEQHIQMMEGFCKELSGNDADSVDAAVLGHGHVAEFATVVTFKNLGTGNTIIDAHKIDVRRLPELADDVKRRAFGLAHPRHKDMVELLGVAARRESCSLTNRDNAVRAKCAVWRFIDAIDPDVARQMNVSPHALAAE